MSTLEVSNLNDGTTTVATTFVTNGSAKAWCRADGAASVSGSFNISAGTDHGTGDYSYSLTSSFSDNNYSQSSVAVTGAEDSSATRNSSRHTSSVLACEVVSSGSLSNKGNNIIAQGDLA